jgi:hypothetical protein
VSWFGDADEEQSANDLACQLAAKKAGLIEVEASLCDDGEYECPECPWKTP